DQNARHTPVFQRLQTRRHRPPLPDGLPLRQPGPHVLPQALQLQRQPGVHHGAPLQEVTPCVRRQDLTGIRCTSVIRPSAPRQASFALTFGKPVLLVGRLTAPPYNEAPGPFEPNRGVLNEWRQGGVSRPCLFSPLPRPGFAPRPLPCVPASGG